MTWMVQGIFLGLVLMLSTGPSFFYLIKVGIEEGFRKAFAFAFGIFISDVFLLTLIFIGLQPLFKNEIFNQIFSLSSGLIIIVFGLSMLLKKKVTKTEIELNPSKELPILAYVLKGMGINLFNPFTLVMWVGVLGAVSPPTKSDFMQFVTGILSVIFLADVTKAYLAKLIGKVLTESAIVIINKILGSAFILIGVYFIYLFYASFSTGQGIQVDIPKL